MNVNYHLAATKTGKILCYILTQLWPGRMGKLKRVRVDESKLQFDRDFFNQSTGTNKLINLAEDELRHPDHVSSKEDLVNSRTPTTTPPLQTESPQSPAHKHIRLEKIDDVELLSPERIGPSVPSESSDVSNSKQKTPSGSPEIIDLVDSDSDLDPEPASEVQGTDSKKLQEQTLPSLVSLHYVCIIPGHEVSGYLELRSDRSLRPLDEIFEPELDDYVFVHEDMRVYSFAKPEVLAPGKSDITIKVMSSAQLQEIQEKSMNNYASSDAGSDVDAEDRLATEEENLTIKIISQARHPVEVGVKSDTKMHRIASYFLEKLNFPLTKQVRLEFDHEPVDLNDTVASLDMEDGDCLDCFLL